MGLRFAAPSIALLLLAVADNGRVSQTGTRPDELKAVRGDFEFETAGGAPPIHVWYCRSGAASTQSRVVILMHGSSRTGEQARDIGAPLLEDRDVVLLAPEFRERDYPGDRYAFANMTGASGTPTAGVQSGFGVIERLFDRVRESLNLSAATYDIAGHSAGGQFVQRMVLFAPSARFRRAVASSPGRYALPTTREAFPYGVGRAGFDAASLAASFGRDFVLLLGDRDTADTEREPPAMLQGANRFARGLRFFAMATEEAAALRATLAWRLKIVSGADHTPGPMVAAALRELLD